MKKSLTIGAKFTAFQKAMYVLAGWRSCDFELAGLEEALDRATSAMKPAQSLLSMLEIDLAKPEDLSPLAVTQLELAYNAIIVVAVVVAKEVGMELECPDKLAQGRCATISMLDALAPFLRTAWHREILRPADKGDCEGSEPHAS